MVEAPVTPQSKEIILCRSVRFDLGDGHRVIVRAADETEREMKGVYFLGLNSTHYQRLAAGIHAVIGLPVRLVVRRHLLDGTLQETPWILPAAGASFLRSIALLTFGATPFIGGIIVGWLLPSATVTVVTGLALWVGM